jgi:predicted NUDIX family NTP pyrophosphohydrolase
MRSPTTPGGEKAVADRATAPRRKKISAGVLVYRFSSGVLEVFLAHPGGPFWTKRDQGAWTIPKGEAEEGADLLQDAKREFCEETGMQIDGDFIELTPLRQPGGKTVHAWAVSGEIDPSRVKSNTFSMEWPPRSGKQQEFPEVDRAQWFVIAEAFDKLLAGQRGFLEELVRKVGIGPTVFAAQTPHDPKR